MIREEFLRKVGKMHVWRSLVSFGEGRRNLFMLHLHLC
jgi:hypothetical protein